MTYQWSIWFLQYTDAVCEKQPEIEIIIADLFHSPSVYVKEKNEHTVKQPCVLQ